MRKLIFTLLFFIISLFAKSQKVELFYDFNFGILEAFSLRSFHSDLANQVTIDNFETTDNFYYYYGFTVGVRVFNRASLYFNNRVSGAKTSLADYSGYIRLTNELKANTYGFRYEFYRKQLSKGNIHIGAKGFIINSKLILKTEAEVNNETDDDKIEFKSLDFGVGAGISYEYPFKYLILKAYLDLDLVYGGKIKLIEDNLDDGYLMDESGNKVNTGWSGFNAGIGISIPLSK